MAAGARLVTQRLPERDDLRKIEFLQQGNQWII